HRGPFCLCPWPRHSTPPRRPKLLHPSGGATSNSRHPNRQPRRRRRSRRVSRCSPKVTRGAEREVEASQGRVPIQPRLDLLHQGIGLVGLSRQEVEQTADAKLITGGG